MTKQIQNDWDMPHNTQNNKFKNKDGSTSMYGFAMGYGQRTDIDGDASVFLFHSGGTLWDVKFWDMDNRYKTEWLQAESLTEARKLFKQTVNKYRAMLA